jgi:hypothetical protein
MRVAAVLTCASLSWWLAGEVPLAQRESQAEPYGYVVGISAGSHWRVASTRGTAQISIGTVLKPAERVTAGTEPAPTLSVMEYATGRVVSLKSGQLVPSAAAPRPSGWARLSEAIARRLSNERLSEGVVRARPRLTDAARATGSNPWSSVVVDLPPGSYRARFRRLDRDGAPVGEWVTSIDLIVAASGFTPTNLPTDLDPGLWQVSIRHRDSPSVGGEAWLLLTKDGDAVRQFNELSQVLAGSADSGDPEVVQGTLRVRRAALLALAP